MKDLLDLTSLFLEVPETESEWAQIIVRHGYSLAEAEQFVAFVPLAFGRALLQQMVGEQKPFNKISFSSTYQVMDNDKKFSLDAEPVYVMAMELAQATLKTGILGEQFKAIAITSAEVGCVDKVLKEGATVAEIEFPPVLIFVGYETLGK